MSQSLHGLALRTGYNQPAGSFVPPGKFGRLFPALPPFLPPEADLDALAAAMTDTDPNSPGGDNPDVPAGYTYLGQFVDHDITFDPTALSGALVDPLGLRNFRTPALDLDCLYGGGPAAQPYMYQRFPNGELFEIGRTNAAPGGGDPGVPVSLPHDLPRAANGHALLGDPRNDENLVVGQTHLAFLRFHNKVVAAVKAGTVPQPGLAALPLFEAARQVVTWHYQWVVLNDFVRRITDPYVFADVVSNGRKYFRWEHASPEPFIPVEFAVAAYRLGHSMVREEYDYNRVFTPKPGGVIPASLGLLFRFSGVSTPLPVNANTIPIPSDWIIDWRRFVDVDPAVQPQLSRALDPMVVPALTNLPNVPPPNSLAVRNLRRGRMLGLPSGQAVAMAMGFAPLSPADIATGPDGAVAAAKGFHLTTPLWYYILKEAEKEGNARRLGPVGSRIVTEVFVGLLDGDPQSFRSQAPNWTPVLPAASPGEFTLADLIAFGGELNPIG